MLSRSSIEVVPARNKDCQVLQDFGRLPVTHFGASSVDGKKPAHPSGGNDPQNMVSGVNFPSARVSHKPTGKNQTRGVKQLTGGYMPSDLRTERLGEQPS